jgi:ferredoxin--NADP+ reductase
MVGRRGPAQAAFTNPELKELGDLEEAEVIVPTEEITLDPLTEAYVREHPDQTVNKNLKTLEEYAKRDPGGKKKRIHLMFLASPVELTGNGHVEAIKLVKNELTQSSDGSLRPKTTDRFENLPVGMVFRSIGYMGVQIPGVPFDAKNGVFPNTLGRLIDPTTQTPIPGVYAVGWIKRGPSGIIGTNKPDSGATVEKMLEDVPQARPLDPAKTSREAVTALLKTRQPRLVSYEDWQILDALEIERGAAVNRPRLKFSVVEEMLDAISERKAASPK